MLPELVPADIEIRRNHLYKPLAWQAAPWRIKNLFELKTARRVLVEGNVLENNWAGAHEGYAVVLKSVNQGRVAPWSGTTDVTFRYNVIRAWARASTWRPAPRGGGVVPLARVRDRAQRVRGRGHGGHAGVGAHVAVRRACATWRSPTTRTSGASGACTC
jgi:hypothetical protein